MSLSDTQVERYSRQIILPEIGGRGQERLLQSALALTNAQEPCVAAARYLVAAGVGRVVLQGEASALLDELRENNPDLRAGDGAVDLVLAGDAAPERKPRGRPLWLSGGVWDARAWVWRGGRPAPVCARCAAVAPPRSAHSEPALGVAGAQMALFGLTHLLGGEDHGARAPRLICFDVASGQWRAPAEGSCVVCAARGDA